MHIRTTLARSFAVGGSLVLAFVAGGFASWQVLAGPDREVIQPESYLIAEAVVGTIEQSLQLNTSASWSATSSYTTQAAGTITEVLHEDGERVDTGDVLFTVDLEPVVVAEGTVPMFRSLSDGAEGTDVAQLQRFLAETGYYDGDSDGKFDYRVRWAVRAWQEDVGMAVTGEVEAGAILFLPKLPVPIALVEEIDVGSVIGSGTTAIESLPESPDFSIELPDGQARLVEPEMTVEIAANGSVWHAKIDGIEVNENEIKIATLTAVEGDSICNEECGQIPIDESAVLPSTIYIVPEVEGVTVPAASIVTDAAGVSAVVTEAGEVLPVEILAGVDGTVVVEGVDVGQRVRVRGGDGR